MVLLTDCMACRVGDHAHHTEVIQAAPEGVMGGSACPCTGDCVTRNEQSADHVIGILGGGDQARAVLDLLEGVQ